MKQNKIKNNTSSTVYSRLTSHMSISRAFDTRINKKIKMIIIVIACYFTLHLPIQIVDSVNHLMEKNPPWTKNTGVILSRISLINCYLFPVIQPFIFASQINIRKAIISLVLCKNKQTKHSGNEPKKKQTVMNTKKLNL